MKRVALIVLAALAVIGAGAKATAAALDPERARRADVFLDHLDASRYEEALVMTTPGMREALGNGKLKETWETLPKLLGARTARSEVRAEAIDSEAVVTSTLTFPMLSLDARISFDAANQISGFWIVPARATVAAPALETSRPWREIELAFGNGANALPGTLTLPDGKGPFAVVVLVHGSGAHDRDETIGPNKPFRDLAHGLADHDIAVLRYEKRSKAHPQTFAHRDYTIDDETVDDALAAVDALHARSGIDAQRIFVAGHSLGAMMAPRIGERDTRIAGLILLAAPATRLEDIVIRQTRYLAHLDRRSDAEIDAAIAPIERQRDKIRKLSADSAADDPLMLGLPARYWLDLNRYDPIATARAIAQPLLVLQGGRDYQVTRADDFELWKNAFAHDPRVRLIEYPLLGHAFMPGNDPPGPQDYQQSAHVDAQVIADIQAWIASRPARRERAAIPQPFSQLVP